MDLDDLLGELFGGADLGLSRSRRAQLVARMLFGFLGAGLGLVGAWFMLTRTEMGGSASLRACMALVFVGMASFFAFNVMLGRRWIWPWMLLAGAFVALFVLRLAGA